MYWGTIWSRNGEYTLPFDAFGEFFGRQRCVSRRRARCINDDGEVLVSYVVHDQVEALVDLWRDDDPSVGNAMSQYAITDDLHVYRS